MFPGAENKKEKKRADGISSSETYLFCFHKKCFARCHGGSFSQGFLVLSILLPNVQKLKHYFLKMLMMI